MTEAEKLAKMLNAENVAQEIFANLKDKIVNEKLSVIESLHVGIVLSSYLINAAGKVANHPKELILDQFVEALEGQMGIYKMLSYH